MVRLPKTHKSFHSAGKVNGNQGWEGHRFLDASGSMPTIIIAKIIYNYSRSLNSFKIAIASALIHFLAKNRLINQIISFSGEK